MNRILVTGACGQIGSELVAVLRDRFGPNRVVATDIREPTPDSPLQSGPFHILDCTDPSALDRRVREHRADTVFHLAAILSAVAEARPQDAYRVNLTGLFNVLETARTAGCAVFVPSSIAAFGPSTPPDPAPQDTIQRPTSMYGVTKVAGELLCDYYHSRYGLDVRGVRYPGLISWAALPGGGTTDYAVEIFYRALEDRRYTCFLGPDTQLDMMYMPDALRASVELMDAEPSRLRHRNAFNVTAMQLTPERLADSIREWIPEFEIEYDVDPVRQAIAQSWPRSIDDSAARQEWDWNPEFDLKAMTRDMLTNLAPRLGVPDPTA